MNRSIKLLSVLLLVQLVLIALVWSGVSGSAQGQSTALVADPDQISRITLDDPEEGELTLIHADAGWQLSAPGEEEDNQTDGAEPADEARVAALLDRLRALRRDYPVAHSAQAQTRFKVASDDYRRKLTLIRANGDSTTLLVGTSPAMGESHLRLEGEESIYRGELPLYELSVDPQHWKKPRPPADESASAADSEPVAAEPEEGASSPSQDADG